MRPLVRPSPFEAHAARYDRWFERHAAAYQSELLLLRGLLPPTGRGLEIGVGTGRFAAPLKTWVGLEPSRSMARRAAGRGVRTVRALGEALPFADRVFDYTMSVTILCFVADPFRLLAESFRVTRPGGVLVVGMLDAGGPAGQAYLDRHAKSPFFRGAWRHTAAEVEALARRVGFTAPAWHQTLTSPPETIRVVEPAVPGHGRGVFAALRAIRPV